TPAPARGPLDRAKTIAELEADGSGPAPGATHGAGRGRARFHRDRAGAVDGRVGKALGCEVLLECLVNRGAGDLDRAGLEAVGEVSRRLRLGYLHVRRTA